ncbi:hypothetical protein C8R44DRAFT_992832 [Mycena epipterygia]|nr:hypothetical protein C8R44DRAFT_992832 [Mycena epipterygia]
MADSHWEKEPPLDIETLVALKNSPLPASDASLARPWLLEAEKQLMQINDEIKALKLRRSVLLPAVEAYRVALAPHKILPVDVLREIFLCAVSLCETDLATMVYGQATLDLHLVLCQICSHWRSVALDTHEFWSEVGIHESLHRVPNCTRLVKVLDIWLSRSGKHPITFYMFTGADPLFKPILTKYSNRFRDISIEADNVLVDLPAGSMDRLEKLALSCFTPRKYPMTAFVGAPRLRDVSLFLYSDRMKLEMCAAPWNQVTHLCIEDSRPASPFAEYYDLLEKCTALTDASLQFRFEGPVELADRHIVLPQLKTLCLAGKRLASYAKFLESFVLPSLVDLMLVSVEKTKHYTSFSVPTFPMLQQLVINFTYTDDPTYIDDPMLLPWLRACPSVIEVLLPHYQIPDSTLHELADGSILPNVQLLSIKSAELGTLIAALRARHSDPDHSTITKVGLRDETRPSPSMQEIESLSELLNVGVFVANIVEPTRWHRENHLKIQQRARLDFEAGSGLFERLSSTEAESSL